MLHACQCRGTPVREALRELQAQTVAENRAALVREARSRCAVPCARLECCEIGGRGSAAPPCTPAMARAADRVARVGQQVRAGCAPSRAALVVVVVPARRRHAHWPGAAQPAAGPALLSRSASGRRVARTSLRSRVARRTPPTIDNGAHSPVPSSIPLPGSARNCRAAGGSTSSGAGRAADGRPVAHRHGACLTGGGRLWLRLRERHGKSADDRRSNAHRPPVRQGRCRPLPRRPRRHRRPRELRVAPLDRVHRRAGRRGEHRWAVPGHARHGARDARSRPRRSSRRGPSPRADHERARRRSPEGSRSASVLSSTPSRSAQPSLASMAVSSR